MLWWNYCLLKSATIGHTEKKNMRQPTPRRRLPSDYQMSLTKEQEKDREPGTKRCLVAVSSASQEMFIFIWGSPDWWQKGWKITGSSSSLQKHVLKNRFANKEIKPVHPKGNQPWIFIGRTDDEAPIIWPPDAKNWLVETRPWSLERWMTGVERGDRGWNGCMALSAQWTWAWANSRR